MSAGACTRPDAAALAAVLLGAVTQNLMASGNAQPSDHCALLATTFVVAGGGCHSADAVIDRRMHPFRSGLHPAHGASRTTLGRYHTVAGTDLRMVDLTSLASDRHHATVRAQPELVGEHVSAL